jgi:aryl carrier-like protein
VGVEDNFISLGGDSIFSLRVVSMLKSRGVLIDVLDIFQRRTVAELAEQAREVWQEQEPVFDANQIAQMLISEDDAPEESAIETIL